MYQSNLFIHDTARGSHCMRKINKAAVSVRLLRDAAAANNRSMPLPIQAYKLARRRRIYKHFTLVF